MTERTYPFEGWILSGSFVPRRQTFIRGSGWMNEKWHKNEKGQSHKDSEVFDTKEKAIESGLQKIKGYEEKILKMQQGIAKKLANLEKHA